ncbi:MAG: hypothetical protein U5N53_02125 [Mycobacterium sp.]|nr:hypothetical protein [Mycobacterium sp.]
MLVQHRHADAHTAIQVERRRVLGADVGVAGRHDGVVQLGGQALGHRVAAAADADDGGDQPHQRTEPAAPDRLAADERDRHHDGEQGRRERSEP